MIISESIRAWVRNHDLQDTLRLMESGEVIVFVDEDMSTADSMAATVLTAAYMYFEVERERRSIQQREMYKRRVAAGEYTPRDYFGYVPGTFIPDENRKFVVEMFLEASQGVEADEIAEWMNDCGLRTVKGNELTPRAVRAMCKAQAHPQLNAFIVTAPNTPPLSDSRSAAPWLCYSIPRSQPGGFFRTHREST